MLYVYFERVQLEEVCLSHIGNEVLKGAGDWDWFDLCLRCSLPETLPLLTRDRISNYIIFVGICTAGKQILCNMQLMIKGRSKNLTLCDLEVC